MDRRTKRAIRKDALATAAAIIDQYLTSADEFPYPVGEEGGDEFERQLTVIANGLRLKAERVNT